MINEGDDLNIIFFDSDCISCNKFARFMNTLDKNDRLYFSGIGSNTFISMKRKYQLPEIDSIIYFDSNSCVVYYYTDAIVEMLIEANRIFYFLKLQYVMPLKFRRKLYQFFASRRKRVQMCEVSSLDKRFQKNHLISRT